MKKNDSFNDYIVNINTNSENSEIIQAPINVTLQVTDDCCCNCSYCYQINKGKNYMSKSTAKNIANLLFKMNTNTSGIINNKTIGFIFDFIGGEPFLNIDTISFFCDYFMEICLKTNNTWINTWRSNITSNGTYYFEPKVQDFLEKYKYYNFLTITLDGPKNIHNQCRKYLNGIGQFDDAYKAFKHAQEHFLCNSTKITISPENLLNINTIIDFFIDEGISQISANVIFEHQWTYEESSIFYKELKKMADTLLKYPNIYCSLFEENFFHQLSKDNVETWCGGTGKMLAFDPTGICYPCLRYMESSLKNDQIPLIIGNCTNGIYNTKETQQIYTSLCSVNRKSQSTEECFNCPIAAGCAYCSAWNYQLYGTTNSRCTYICNMHKARSLANVYYWNNYYKQNHINRTFKMYLPKEETLKIISKKEYDLLYKL